MQGLSITEDECVKLWILYPPTDHNLEAFYKYDGENGKFIQLADKLEEGKYTTTTNGQIMYLPAGWLHLTYTLEGGILHGINWVASDDLDIALKVFLLESEIDPDSGIRLGTKTVVDAFVSAFEAPKYRNAAMRPWCKSGEIVSGQGEFGKQVAEMEDMAKTLQLCPRCEKNPMDHFTCKTKRTRSTVKHRKRVKIYKGSG